MPAGQEPVCNLGAESSARGVGNKVGGAERTAAVTSNSNQDMNREI